MPFIIAVILVFLLFDGYWHHTEKQTCIEHIPPTTSQLDYQSAVDHCDDIRLN